MSSSVAGEMSVLSRRFLNDISRRVSCQGRKVWHTNECRRKTLMPRLLSTARPGAWPMARPCFGGSLPGASRTKLDPPHFGKGQATPHDTLATSAATAVSAGWTKTCLLVCSRQRRCQRSSRLGRYLLVYTSVADVVAVWSFNKLPHMIL